MTHAEGSAVPPDPGRPPSLNLPAFVLLAGALLRLVFVLWLNRTPNDTLLYADIARNWFHHGVYGFTVTLNGLPAPPRPTLIRLPGYPLFLGLCFSLFGWSNLKAVLLVQAAADLGTCWLAAAIAARLFGPRARLPALTLGALCPFLANYSAVPITETLTISTVALAFYVLLRWQAAGTGLNRWVPWIAFALSYSLLLRPDQGLLAAAVIPAMLWISWQASGRRLTFAAIRPGLAAALLTLLPLVPWTVRNERTFHVFQPLAPKSAADPGERTTPGFQRWFRTWAIDYAATEDVYWPYDNDEIELTNLPGRAFDSPAQRAAIAAILNDYNRDTTATPALDARFDAIARERIAASPLRYYLLLPAARVLDMAFRPRTSFLPLPYVWWRLQPKPLLSLTAAMLAVLNLGYFALAALGWARRRRLAITYTESAPIFWSMMASILLRSAMLLTIDNSEPRYTLEFYPIVIVLAAASLIGSRPRGLRKNATDRRPR